MSAASLTKGEHLSQGLGVVLQDCLDEVPASTDTILNQAPARASPGEGVAAGSSPAASLEDQNNVALAWGLTAMSALSTLVGASLVGCATPEHLGYLSFLEAFTAGVMLQGSLTGLSTKAALLTADSMHPTAAFWTILACFFGGAGICVLLEIMSHQLLGHPTHSSISALGGQGAASAALAVKPNPPASDREASLVRRPPLLPTSLHTSCKAAGSLTWLYHCCFLGYRD